MDLTSCGQVESIEGEVHSGLTSCGGPSLDLAITVSPLTTAKRYGLVEIEKFIGDEGVVELIKDGEVVWQSDSIVGEATLKPSREELEFDRDGETKELNAQFIPEGANEPSSVTDSQNLTVRVLETVKSVEKV